LKKYIILLLIMVPLLLQSQTFKSYGLQGGYSLAGKGWEHPDSTGSYYHNKAFIQSINIGGYAEFLSKKYYSTMLDIVLKFREYHFEYDLTPNSNDARLIDNNMYILSIAAYEKLKMDFDRWSVYVFGGIRANYRFKNSIDYDILDVFTNSNEFTAGITTGIGFRKRIEKFLSISVDLYYDGDFTKMYESNYGYVRNNEFGIRIGFGPFNPATK